VKEEAQDASRPKVVSVTPTNDARAVNAVTELRVRFDRPMEPLALKLNWDAGGCLDCDFPQYDPDKYEFAIPVHLTPGALQQLVVNEPMAGEKNLSEQRKEFPREGFQSVDHRLAGLFVWRFRTQAAPAPSRTPPPQVTLLSPASGERVPFRTFLEIQFDQPMTPPTEAFPYLRSERGMKEPGMICRGEYDAARHAFRIPLLLPPKEKVEFTLTGFRSASGVAARPIKLQYQVSGDELAKADQAKLEAGAREPQLLDLLKNMKQERSQLTSLAERVQTLDLRQQDGLFVELKSQSATFRWQKPAQYYGDVTEPMMTCSDFRIGSDGQRWWWHSASARRTNLVVCSAMDLHELNVSICDPFELTRQKPAAAASDLGLNYAGVSKVGAAECHLVEAWQIENVPGMTPSGSLVQWQIDRRNYRPAAIAQFYDFGVIRQRFLYDAVNTPLPEADFAVPKVEGLAPKPPEPLDAGYTHRFVNLCDGSDGNMSVRWGKKGPKGRSSGGLN
jgi:hypothetical protein